MTPYDWPPSPHLDAWAMRVRLEALCRAIRAILGAER